jgi:16S rRNA (cytidine1402-2'-O)-methyltransferase
MTGREKLKPGIYIISLPIGNSKDITIRAIETLEDVDEIYCEDTRVTRKILSIYKIKKTLSVYHDHNGEKIRPKIIDKIKNGKSIGIVSDAGTPLISDPGYKLITLAKKEGLYVSASPGVSAPITALTLSGAPTDSFYFLGFLPTKKKSREQILNDINPLKTSIIIFESTKKINKTLEDIHRILGDRNISICREMTKKFEEIITGRVTEIINLIKESELKGEVSLVIYADKDKGIPDFNIEEIIRGYNE